MKLVLQEALVTSVTNRGEGNAKDPVPAHTIAVTAALPLGAMKSLNPNLKTIFYTDEKEPIPRVEGIGAFNWKFEYEGAEVYIDEALEFFGADVKKIVITPEPQGVWTIQANINVRADKDVTRGKLAALVKHKVKIVLQKMTQKTIEEIEEEDDAQPDLPGTNPTADGKPIQPLLPGNGETVRH